MPAAISSVTTPIRMKSSFLFFSGDVVAIVLIAFFVSEV
jgi:hypothetical protein